MEFKGPDRRQRPTPASSQRGRVPLTQRQANNPAPEAAKSTPEPPKRTGVSGARQFLLSKKGALLIGVLSVIIIALFIRQAASDTSGIKSPTYDTVLPKNKSISDLGGWKRVSPPDEQPVFAFADTVDGVTVSVTQQPLPESFKSDPAGKTAEVAQKFNATNEIKAGDTTVYIGTSSKGPQSVIFTKNNLLVLIKSEKKVSDDSWAAYAESLD